MTAACPLDEMRIRELEEVITLWEQHGGLHGSEDCDGCYRVETFRLTGFLPPEGSR